jgi:hypothetical protein
MINEQRVSKYVSMSGTGIRDVAVLFISIWNIFEIQKKYLNTNI